MIYLHYDDAQQAFDLADPHAKIIIERVNSFMISDAMRHSGWRPKHPFDMRYFYASLVRVVGLFFGRSLRSGLEDASQIIPVNFPDLTISSWRQFDFVICGLAELYVAELRRSAAISGSSFDVEFACTVACNSIDRSLLPALKSKTESNEIGDDFDQWLAGFNQ